MHHTDKYSQHSPIIWPIWLNAWVFNYKLSGCGFESCCCHLNFTCGACFKQGLPWHSGKLKSGFTLNLVCDMIVTYSQMHHTDKYSQHSPIIWPIWLNAWVFNYKLSGCGFESCCCHLNFTCGTCFEQGVPWYSGKLKSVDSPNNIQLFSYIPFPHCSPFLIDISLSCCILYQKKHFWMDSVKS